jgi:hypothetical protein
VVASKSLSFLLFGEDVSASRAFEKVARSAEKADATVKGSFSKGSILGIGTLVAGLGLAAKGAADFQTQMTRLVTAAGESQSNLNMVSKGVMTISSATGTGLKATGDAMYYIESAGFHGQRGLNVLKAAAEGAKVEGADTKVVADALTTALTDLGAKAGPPAQVMSQLVATVAHGKMTMDDLAGSLHSVLPNAAAIGISFAQVAGAIATMTAQGISADQATQNLNHAILSLANPTAVQTAAMAAMGLNSSVVARNLGRDGLTGTLEELSSAITAHMGPAGVTITNALNSSQIAAGKATEAYKAMTPAMQKYADEVISGAQNTVTARQLGQGFDLAQKTQIQQWEKLYKGASGFSDLLKAKSPDALTYAAALARMTGGQTGLQVAMHLTGGNMTTFKSNVADISKATSDAGGHVQDFALKQKTLNQKLDELKTSAKNAGVAFGTDLIPPLTTAADFVLKHKGAFEAFAIAIVGIKLAVGGMKLAHEAWDAAALVSQGVQKVTGISFREDIDKTIAKEAELAAAAKLANGEVAGTPIPGVAGPAVPAVAPRRGVKLPGLPFVPGGVITSLAAPLITSGDQSQLQRWQTAMDSLQKQYPNIKKLGVEAFGSLAVAMQKGRITTDEYKDALRAGSIQVANDEARTRLLSQAMDQSAAKTGYTRDQTMLLSQEFLSQGHSVTELNAAVKNHTLAQQVAAGQAGVTGQAIGGESQKVSGLNTLLYGTPRSVAIAISTPGLWQAMSNLQQLQNEASAAQAAAQAVGSMTTHLNGHASGGYLDLGWNRVGEQGPEMVFNGGGGNSRVLTASETRQARGGTNITINVNAGMGTDGAAVGRQIATALERHTNSGGTVHISRGIR